MQVEIGSILEGKVSGIVQFGAFIQLEEGKTGLVHISEVSDEYVKDIKDYLKENQPVKVKVLSVDPKGKIALSIKKAFPQKAKVKSSNPIEIDWSKGNNDSLNFEERLSRFMKDSEEKMHDLKKSFESKRGGRGYGKKSISI
jgi:S1 RNA binding domain protein